MSTRFAVRLSVACVALAAMQLFLVYAESAEQCTICSGPNTPQAGSLGDSCNGADQTGIFDELNPSGKFYKAPFGFNCSKPGEDGGPSVQCSDLQVGCCPAGFKGWFMCNIDVQSDCSFKSVCAAICCPTGFQDTDEVMQPGCPNKDIILVCTATGTP